jgi:imidazolonepropionase-like amidohydrolase
MDRVARGDVWLTPTLVVSGDGPKAKLARVEPHLARWPEWMHDMMRPTESEVRVETDERLRGLRALFEDLNNRGARWLAGSDAPNPGSAPGVGLHHELELLVDFGLTPAQALQAATIHAAEFERRSDLSGTIEVGKEADLLLLAANPLEDIRNSLRIETVVLRGRIVRSR